MDEKKILKVNYFWATILLILLFTCLFYSYISGDAPYYLPIARDISEGVVPFKDISSMYVPVMMYINSILYIIFENPTYNVFLAYQFFFIILTCYYFYKISKQLNVSKAAAVFYSLFFAISILSSEGSYINLEVYVILFVVIAYWNLINKKFLWSGIFLALSVFSKQYGIFNYVPFLLLTVFYFPYDRKNILLFILGSSIPVVAFFGYYVIYQDVSITSLLTQLSGSGYGESGLSAPTDWFGLIIGSKVFILLLLPLLFIRNIYKRDKINLILIVGLLVNLLPVLVKSFSHYFILTFPYAFLLMAHNSSFIKPVNFYLSNFSLLVISSLLLVRTFKYKDRFANQLQTAEKYEKVHPKGSKVFLKGDVRVLYLLNEYRNPVLKEVGYDYSFTPDETFIQNYHVISDSDQ